MRLEEEALDARKQVAGAQSLMTRVSIRDDMMTVLAVYVYSWVLYIH
jgi:hypothetical protein